MWHLWLALETEPGLERAPGGTGRLEESTRRVTQSESVGQAPPESPEQGLQPHHRQASLSMRLGRRGRGAGTRVRRKGHWTTGSGWDDLPRFEEYLHVWG